MKASRNVNNNYPPRPVALKVEPHSIPRELLDYDNWVLWFYELRENGNGEAQWTKPPIQINSSYAKSSDPRTWASFSRVVEHYRQPFGIEPDGIGFRPTENVVAIDLDHCRDKTGDIEDWAIAIIQTINSYTELSPSATGVRIIAYGELPPGRRKKGNVEMYDKSSPRYLTMTGQHLEGTPRGVEHRQLMINQVHQICLGQKAEEQSAEPDDVVASDNTGEWTCTHSLDEIMLRALDAQNGEKFDLLRQGRWQEAGYSSHSEADLALVRMIAFWAGPDPNTIELVFRSTNLVREKWDSRRGSQTYGEMTVEKGMYLDSYYQWRSTEYLDDDLSGYIKDADAYLDDAFVEDSYVDEETDCRAQDVEEGPTDLISLKTLRDRALAIKRTWIAADWIQSGHLIVLSGREKRGKSTLVADLITAIISEQKWLDVVDTIRVPVLLCDYENPEDYIWFHIGNMLEEKGANIESCDPYFSIVDPAKIRNTASPMSIDYALQRINHMSKQTGCDHGLFVIDTAMPAFMALFDDTGWTNNNASVRQALEIGQQIARQSGWAVLVIYHYKKGGTDAAGSYEWQGVPDAFMRFDRELDSRVGNISVYGRLGNTPAPIDFVMQGSRLTADLKARFSNKESQDVNEYMQFCSLIPEDEAHAISKNQLEIHSQSAGISKRKFLEHYERADGEGRFQTKPGPRNAIMIWRQ